MPIAAQPPRYRLASGADTALSLRRQLSQYPIKTRLSLSGTLIVARDIAHAKLKERIDAGQGLPQVPCRG